MVGILKQIEDVSTGTILYTIAPNNPALAAGLKRRSGTYTVAGADYGVDPFGSLPAPLDIGTFTYAFMVVIPPGGTLDAARDALYRVVGPGTPQRLVYADDSGHEWVCTAKCMAVAETIEAESRFRQNYTVTWERLELWRSRAPRSAKVYGQSNPALIWGQSSPVIKYGDNATPMTSASTFVNVIADGSDGLPIPTADDTTPTFFLQGPFGSDVTVDALGNYTGGGLAIGNVAAKTPDFSGAPQPIQFTFYGKLGPLDTLAVNCASQSVLLNGGPAYAKFLTPAWQQEWARVKAGIVNVFNIGATGANPVFNANASQPLALIGNPNGGTFRLTIVTADGVSHLSEVISWADTAATVKTHITTNATPAISGSDIVVTGGPLPNAPIFIGFVGANAGKRIATIVASANTLSGPVTPVIAIPAGNRDTTILALTGNPTGGTFTVNAITPNPGSTTQTTTAIPRNATAAQVFNSLFLLPALSSGAFSVTGGPLPNVPLTIVTGGPTAGIVFTAVGATTGGGTGATAAALAQSFGGTGSFALNWYAKKF